MMREVIDGERLSGHGSVAAGYPEICIRDGIGVGGGALICSIQYFHWVDVSVTGEGTELSFEDKACVAIRNGIVLYADGRG